MKRRLRAGAAPSCVQLGIRGIDAAQLCRAAGAAQGVSAQHAKPGAIASGDMGVRTAAAAPNSPVFSWHLQPSTQHTGGVVRAQWRLYRRIPLFVARMFQMRRNAVAHAQRSCARRACFWRAALRRPGGHSL